MNSKSKIIFSHIFVVAGVISFEVYYAKFFGSKAGFWDFALFYILNISLFYFNAHVIVLNGLRNNRFWLRIFPWVVLELAFYSLLYITFSAILVYCSDGKINTSKEGVFLFKQSLFRGVLILSYSMFYCFARHRIVLLRIQNQMELEKAVAEKRQVELENKMLLAENALLESQIKTHLLFNTLSYVYDKTMDLPGGPGEAVLILNEVMRYSLKKVPADGKMPINEEIAHIRNIVRLGELRHDEGLFIEIETVNVDNPEYRIIASMLSTFVENMFKYGDLKDPDMPAKVSAKVEGGTFSFRATNKKTARSGQESHKIGLDNLRRRLQYAYDSFSLIVTDNPDEFIIDLKVPV